jgi:hypothetical protein
VTSCLPATKHHTLLKHKCTKHCTLSSPYIPQNSHTSIFSDPSAPNTTQEFAIRLQNNANYDRDTLFKQRPKNTALPTSSLTATLQKLFPAQEKQKQKKKKTKMQTAQIAAKKKKHDISNAQWKEINDANKKLLAEQKIWKKNQDFRREHDSPNCIICKEQRPEDPTHIFTACPPPPRKPWRPKPATP